MTLRIYFKKRSIVSKCVDYIQFESSFREHSTLYVTVHICTEEDWYLSGPIRTRVLMTYEGKQLSISMKVSYIHTLLKNTYFFTAVWGR